MDEIEKLAASLLHHGDRELREGEPLTPPIVPASTFHCSGEVTAPFQYGRFGHPTWDAVEAQLGLLEQAETVAFPSGMAAIAAVFFATLKSSDTIILPSDGYHSTRLLAEQYLTPLGVDVRAHATADYADAPMEDAALIFVETPCNPTLDVCELATVAKRAHAAGALVLADNSTMTPYLQRPLDLGADISLAADTKAPGGHSDVLFGHVATRDDGLAEKIRAWRKMSGSIPGPFEAWLVHRGLETLEVRLERMCGSAAIIAERLKEHSAVEAIRFPGLKDDPSFTIAERQMTKPGFLISVTLESADVAERFLSGCPYIAETTSFGGVHTSGERRARWGDAVPEGFVRLSIGCEPTEVLWEAISTALTVASR